MLKIAGVDFDSYFEQVNRRDLYSVGYLDPAYKNYIMTVFRLCEDPYISDLIMVFNKQEELEIMSLEEYIRCLEKKTNRQPFIVADASDLDTGRFEHHILVSGFKRIKSDKIRKLLRDFLESEGYIVLEGDEVNEVGLDTLSLLKDKVDYRLDSKYQKFVDYFPQWMEFYTDIPHRDCITLREVLTSEGTKICLEPLISSLHYPLYPLTGDLTPFICFKKSAIDLLEHYHQRMLYCKKENFNEADAHSFNDRITISHELVRKKSNFNGKFEVNQPVRKGSRLIVKDIMPDGVHLGFRDTEDYTATIFQTAGMKDILFNNLNLRVGSKKDGSMVIEFLSFGDIRAGLIVDRAYGNKIESVLPEPYLGILKKDLRFILPPLCLSQLERLPEIRNYIPLDDIPNIVKYLQFIACVFSKENMVSYIKQVKEDNK